MQRQAVPENTANSCWTPLLAYLSHKGMLQGGLSTTIRGDTIEVVLDEEKVQFTLSTMDAYRVKQPEVFGRIAKLVFHAFLFKRQHPKFDHDDF